MKKTVTIKALERVLQEKREWHALATREFHIAYALDNSDNMEYWRDQITRTSGAIAALEEVAELVK